MTSLEYLELSEHGCDRPDTNVSGLEMGGCQESARGRGGGRGMRCRRGGDRIDGAGYGHDEGGRAPAQPSLSTCPHAQCGTGRRAEARGGMMGGGCGWIRIADSGAQRSVSIGFDIACGACLVGTMIRAPVLSSMRRMLQSSVIVSVGCTKQIFIRM